MKLLSAVFLTALALVAAAPAQIQDSTGACSAMDGIWSAAQIYYQDKGQWPKSVQELMTEHYISLPDSVIREWEFLLEYNGPPHIIRAMSKTRKFRSEADLMLPLGISYTVPTGRWQSDGLSPVPVSHERPELRAELARDAIGAIWGIRQSAQVYFGDKGQWPRTTEDLVRQHYVEWTQATVHNWTFGMTGTPPDVIVAVSTAAMPDGPGHMLYYDNGSGTWHGYGASNVQDALEHNHTIYVEPVR